jgi:hypothetical protein
MPMKSLAEAVSALTGDPVLWVISDPQSGAELELGAKTPRQRRIANPHLTDEQQAFEGQHSLFIECAWRVSLPTASFETVRPVSKGAESLELLDHLVGLTIVAADIDDPGRVLSLMFSNRVVLRVDPTARPSRLIGGYTIRLEHVYWSVTEHGEIEQEYA